MLALKINLVRYLKSAPFEGAINFKCERQLPVPEENDLSHQISSYTPKSLSP